MATMNRTFSVKTGIDLANTIILDSNRNISNVNIANVHTVNANSIVTIDGLNVVDQANTARTTANDAYAQANTARDTANDSYAQANTARATANDAYGQANAAYGQANSARDQANTAYGQANAAYGQANDAFGQANAAYSQANVAANTVSITVGGLTLDNKKLLLQNTSSMTIELLDDGTNANLVLKSSGGIAYDTANAAYAQANSARDQANTARGTANDAYAQANTARDTANDAYGQANTARGVANAAYGQANAAYGQANDAFGQANAAYLQANNAYAEANLKLNLTGGTITGDLDVTGNLYVGGNTTYINVSTYTVEDPLIYLAANNDLDDMVDIGFMGGKNAAGIYSHTGLIRHAADDKWYLFDGLAEEGHVNNVVDIANTSLATLRANLEANSILLMGNTVATQANLTIANDQANAAYLQANTAYGQANDAYAQANAGYSQANAAYGQANAAYGQANLAYAEANVSANTVRVYANSAGSLSNKHLNFVNTASIQVSVTDNGDGNANITFFTTGAAVADAYAQANAAYGQANAAYGQANTGYDQANAAYGQANAAYAQANLSYAQANAAYDEANTKVETIVTGLGLSNSVATVANVTTVTITPNIASTTVIGVTKLVDSITSTDTANAATANAVNWLETKKVDRAGDTMTGKLTINAAGEGLEVANANVTNTLTVQALQVTTNTVTTAASGQVVLDIFPTTELASAKYFVQANSGSTYHTTEIILVQEGTNIWITEYGTILTGASLGTFNADIDSGNVRLLFNATQSINTIRAVRYGIVP
jgi:hypothetical protein